MKKFLILLMLMASSTAFAQISYISGQGFATNPFTGGVVTLSYAQVRVCTVQPGLPVPCPLAQIYDVGGNPLSMSLGPNFGQLTTDSMGRYLFACAPGNYNIQIQASANNTPSTNTVVSCPSGASLLSVNNTWAGVNTFVQNIIGNLTGNVFGNISNPSGILNISTPNGTTAAGIQITAGSASAASGGSITIAGGGGLPTGGNIALLPGNGATVTIGTTVGFYNGRPVSGLAAAYVPFSATSQSSNIGATTLFPNLLGLYKVSVYAVVTQAATTSSTLPKVTISWTDKDNGTIQTLDLTATNTGNTLTTVAIGSALINVNPIPGSLTLSTSGYTSVGATPMAYSVYAQVEGMGQ